MNPTLLPLAARHAEYLLHYRPLRPEARPLAFACDATGHVDLDSLGERDRNDYFLARHSIGRGFARPQVQPAGIAKKV